MKLIDKDALVAEIKRIEHETNYEPFTDEALGKRCTCRSLLSFLDTIEVKEVDLEKEFSQWWKSERAKDYNVDILYERYSNVSMKLAKQFFELGINAMK